MKNILMSLRKNNRAMTMLAAVFALVLAVAVLGFLYRKLPEQAAFRQRSVPEERVPDVMKMQSVQQTFTAARDGLTGIDLKLQVPEKEVGSYKGTLDFALYDGNGALVSRQTIAAGSILNYADCSLSFPPIASSAGSRYTVRITPHPAGADERVTLFVVRNDGGGLSINGRDRSGRLEYNCVYRTSRLGSLFNGRRSGGEIMWMIVLSALSVVLLCAIVAFFLKQED